MALAAAVQGYDYTPNWRRGRPDAPNLLPSGQPVAQWMSYAGEAVAKMIGQGMDPGEAIATSQARSAQAAATAPSAQARTTTFNRFVADSVMTHLDVGPGTLSPWTDEVEQYASLWDGQRAREYQGPWERWQRVPSPGACGFCLMLATRTDYTSADAAMYAGGGTGQVRMTTKGVDHAPGLHLSGVQRRRSSKMEMGDRYHRSCRCTVRMSVAGATSPAISPEDYERLSTPDADGNLPVFGTKGWKSTIDQVHGWDTAAVGVPMPKTAPWKDAWKAPPKARESKAAYREWRSTVPS